MPEVGITGRGQLTQPSAWYPLLAQPPESPASFTASLTRAVVWETLYYGSYNLDYMYTWEHNECCNKERSCVGGHVLVRFWERGRVSKDDSDYKGHINIIEIIYVITVDLLLNKSAVISKYFL